MFQQARRRNKRRRVCAKVVAARPRRRQVSTATVKDATESSILRLMRSFARGEKSNAVCARKTRS